MMVILLQVSEEPCVTAMTLNDVVRRYSDAQVFHYSTLAPDICIFESLGLLALICSMLVTSAV
jgi:hypothetical protein